jgi:hypothetical protein
VRPGRQPLRPPSCGRARPRSSNGRLACGMRGRASRVANSSPMFRRTGALSRRHRGGVSPLPLRQRRRFRVRSHDATIQRIRYRTLPVSQYRVWRLERLRAHFEALPDGTRDTRGTHRIAKSESRQINELGRRRAGSSLAARVR